jgi:hypothetical protein
MDPLDHPPQHRVIQLLRPVGRTHQKHPLVRRLPARRPAPAPAAALAAGAGAVELDQELRLQAARRLVLARGPRAQERVDLIDEDDGGGLVARDREERAHELLALADVARREGRRGDAEEGGLVGGARARE